MQSLTHHYYSPETRSRLHSNLQAFTVKTQPLGDLRPAAVVLAIVEEADHAAILLTRRARSLRAHSGQWALPGGRVDEGETVAEGALRELREEINLDLAAESILGTLDDYITRSGYRITPVVVWVGKETEDLHPNPDEVASIHTTRFDDLAREDAPLFERIPQSDREVLSMRLAPDHIYAPTAALLYQFREVCILGRATRVLHYDQPLFAWQ